MSLHSFTPMEALATALGVAAYLAIGIGFGIVYFKMVWWTARGFALGTRTGLAIILIPGRIVLLGAVLTWASRNGAAPLLALALGVLLARPVVMWIYREVAA